jgi:hypothetical protein
MYDTKHTCKTEEYGVCINIPSVSFSLQLFQAGNPFMARRSYTPEDVYWGHQFCNIITKPSVDDEDGHYEIVLDRFNLVERQPDLPQGHPSHLSNLVVGRAKRTVPYPILGENTLVLSDVLCVCPDEKGRLCLFSRVGDTYPSQLIELEAKMILFRWKDPSHQETKRNPGEDTTAAPLGEPYQQIQLEVRICVLFLLFLCRRWRHGRYPNGICQRRKRALLCMCSLLHHYERRN